MLSNFNEGSLKECPATPSKAICFLYLEQSGTLYQSQRKKSIVVYFTWIIEIKRRSVIAGKSLI